MSRPAICTCPIFHNYPYPSSKNFLKKNEGICEEISHINTTKHWLLQKPLHQHYLVGVKSNYMSSLQKKTELLANVAIIVLALLLSGLVIKRYLVSDSNSSAQNNPSTSRRPEVGTTLNLPNIDWAQNGETLLVVISPTCHFCSESAPFYRRLKQEAASKGGIRLVAVSPTDVSESKKYLDGLEVGIEEIRQVPLRNLGVSGTPTLIQVDRQGKVVKSWIGKLDAAEEAEVLSQLGASRART